MTLLRCPKFLRCLTADAGNFDRGHSLTSLLLPLAALGSLPTSARQVFSAPGRAHGPCPTRRCVIGGGRTESSAPTNRSVGRGALTPPPGLVPHSLAKTLSLRTSDRFTGVAIRTPRPRKCFSLHAKKGPRHPAEPLFKPIQFIRNPHCPPCAGAAPHPGCCSLP